MTQKKKNTKAEIQTVKTEDNWSDRKSGMVCANCWAFVGKRSSSGEIKIGRCRANPPTMKGYPVVFPSDWCCSHKLDENKL